MNFELPPIVFGQLGNDKNKRTLLVYGHLDVQPANKDVCLSILYLYFSYLFYFKDGWNTDPFVLTECDGKLFGRGSTDDKGPVIAWVNAIKVLQENNIPVPVNIKVRFSLLCDKIIII